MKKVWILERFESNEEMVKSLNEVKLTVSEHIEDDAKYWLGYKIVKENEGVLRYLMATK